MALDIERESVEMAHLLVALIASAHACRHEAVVEHLVAALEELCKAEQDCAGCLDNALLSLALGTGLGSQ